MGFTINVEENQSNFRRQLNILKISKNHVLLAL